MLNFQRLETDWLDEVQKVTPENPHLELREKLDVSQGRYSHLRIYP